MKRVKKEIHIFGDGDTEKCYLRLYLTSCEINDV